MGGGRGEKRSEAVRMRGKTEIGRQAQGGGEETKNKADEITRDLADAILTATRGEPVR